MASSCTQLVKPVYRVLQVNTPPSPTSLKPFLKPCMGDIDGLNVENEPFRSAGFFHRRADPGKKMRQQKGKSS
jgi:hypothetical protein